MNMMKICKGSWIMYLAILISIAIAVTFYWTFEGPSHMQLTTEERAKNLLAPALTQTTNLVNLAMAVLGATAALGYKVRERRVLTNSEQILIGLAFACLGCSIGFGEEANSQLIDMYCGFGKVTTIVGPFDLASKFQYFLLLIGTATALIALLNHLAGNNDQTVG
jgi:hypothetical protein